MGLFSGKKGLVLGVVNEYSIAWAITQKLRELYETGRDMNAKSIEDYDITLITAARRRFDSWDRALTAAGLMK